MLFGLGVVVGVLFLIVAAVRVAWGKLNSGQRAAAFFGVWLVAADVYYPPYVRVVATAPLIDLAPPSLPRYPRERAIGRWWWFAIDNDSFTHRDLPRLFAEMSAITVATVAVVWLLRSTTRDTVG